MKKFVILLFVLLISSTINAQTQPTAAGTTTTSSNSEDVKTLIAKIEKIQADLKKVEIPPDEVKKEVREKVLSSQQKLLIMLPVALFFLCLFITFLFAKKYHFNFRKSFNSEDAEQITIQSNPKVNPNETIKITFLENGKPVYKPSVSRIIAFLSSLTTLAVIVSFISYYAYCMLKGIDLPDFKNLFEVIVGLGLGIIPYGFNKVTKTTESTTK